MNNPHKEGTNTRFYEYILYWLVNFAILILAVPVLVVKTGAFFLGAVGAPLKSAKNFIGVVVLILLIGAAFTLFEIFYPYDIGPGSKSITIEENDSFASVLNHLQEDGILKGTYLFKAMAVISGVDKSLSPGRYDFSGKVSQYSILKKLKNRDIATIMVTIPEGSTVYETAGIFAHALNIDSANFVSHAFDTSFTSQKYGYEGLEGYLFPETYRLWYGIDADDIIDIMVREFKKKTDGIFKNLPGEFKTAGEAVVMASIIEAEARLDSEKKVISSVYHNRLRKGMLLQADPTVIYGLGGLDRPLYYRDLKIESPYNTYLNKGLPPGPINSPGMAAIEAALDPDNTSYLYFVADGTGKHVFSATLTEHNRAKYRIKKENQRGS